MCRFVDGIRLADALNTQEDDIVFETFQPGRVRKWSRGEMRRLPAVDIQDAVDCGRAVVVADFESGDQVVFRP
jgi:hypothetical protein